MNLHARLREREAQGRPLRVGLIGAGKFAATYLAQVPRTPGARIEDLYAVCGQAQRSVHWKRDPRQLLEHLRRRETRRLQQSSVSRFERGDLPRLREMTRRAPLLIPQFTISIVQPGLARHLVKAEHLKLLAVTELYLQETYAAGFEVIASV